MTLFLPTLVAATSSRAVGSSSVSSSSSSSSPLSVTAQDAVDDAADDPTSTNRASSSATHRTPATPLAEAVRAASEDAMTRIFEFRGGAMKPSLGSTNDARGKSAGSSLGEKEYLLARRLAHPFRSARVGDVVAFAHPSGDSRTLVRRVSALEGDELVDVTNASVYVVPKDHAWVTADADADGEVVGKKGRHEDSRSFGPVHARSLEWRVIYSLRSAADHGAVENSELARVADAPVLEAELERALETLGYD